MKKIMFFVSCLLPLISQAQDKKATINGTVESADISTIYTLRYNKTTQVKTMDSVVVKDGKFQLTVPLDGLVAQVMMYASHGGKGLQKSDMTDSKSLLMDENGTDIHIKESVRNAVLSNNAIEKEKERYVKYMYIAAADSAKMGFYINGVSPIILNIQINKVDTSTAEKKAQYNKTTTGLKKMADFVQQKLEYQRKYVKENPDSYFSLLAIEDIGRYGKNLDEAQGLFAGLSARLKNSASGAEALASITTTRENRLHPEKKEQISDIIQRSRPLSVGTMAPDFTQFDVNDKPVKLSDFKGKYVLLDFWASWCVPCRKENPNLISAYKQFKDKNFTVLGVALEEKSHKDAWLAAIKKDGLLWTQVANLATSDNEVAKAYKVSSIPANFLIDPSGKIIATNLTGPALQAKLSEILSN